MIDARFKALRAANEHAFIQYLRCECKNRLTRKGCEHAQAVERTRREWYRDHRRVNLVAPDEVS